MSVFVFFEPLYGALGVVATNCAVPFYTLELEAFSLNLVYIHSVIQI